MNYREKINKLMLAAGDSPLEKNRELSSYIWDALVRFDHDQRKLPNQLKELAKHMKDVAAELKMEGWDGESDALLRSSAVILNWSDRENLLKPHNEPEADKQV